jgi:hypothetical protein
MKTLASLLIFGAALSAFAGCNLSKSAEAKGDSPAAADKAAPEPAGNARVSVDLTPLPLQAKVAPGGTGAMDMSMDDRKSVTLDIGGGKSLNVSETGDDFATVKQSYENDKIMFPFKKWAKEEASLAIVQFDNEGKTGFIGFTLKQIGGKSYVCKTTGLDGVASAEEAATQLQICDSLSAKGAGEN